MIVPEWSWFVSPSGGPVQPGLWGWLDGIKRRPLVAHPVGAWLVVGFMAIPGVHGVGAWWVVLLAEGINQAYKWMRGVYGDRWALNVVWRMVLAAFPTLPVLWL